MTPSRRLEEVSRELAGCVDSLRFGPPVAFVYNPLGYAISPHVNYLRRYGEGTNRVLLLGMNPGPWGMAQTGVPFGDVVMVREWMGIGGRIEEPRATHVKKPVKGFACGRREVSGSRLWGWARERYGSPESFFAVFFVINYCPLLFLDQGGRNLTPDRLPQGQREALYGHCDRALEKTVRLLAPRLVVGVGGFAARRAEEVLGGWGIPLGRITHPSPANPRANRGWSALAHSELSALGLELPVPPGGCP